MQIFVLGMHRSGTSAVTRLLNMMGAYVGLEDALWGANDENPKGFWERKDLQLLNQRVLEQSGADWHRISTFDCARIADKDREAFLYDAKQILLKLEPMRPWVVKDPRLCLTFPLWRTITDMPVCVIVFRNPLEVAQSLKQRNGFPIPFGLALWEAYTTAALRAASGLPRVYVSYNRLTHDPEREIEALKAAIEKCGVRKLEAPSKREIGAFVDRSLHRQHETDKSLRGHLNRAQAKLYEGLQNGAYTRRSRAPELSAGAAEMLRLYEDIVANAGHLQDARYKATGLQRDAERTANEIAARDRALADAERELETLRNAAAQNEGHLQHARNMANDLQRDAERSANEIAERDRALAGAERELETLRNAAAQNEGDLQHARNMATDLQSDAERAAAEAKRELDALRDAAAQNEGHLQHARNLAADMQRDAERAAAEIAGRDGALADAKRELETLRDAAVENEGHLQHARNIATDLQRDAERVAAEIVARDRALADAERDFEALRGTAIRNETRAASLEADLGRAQQALAQAQAEIENRSTQADVFVLRIAELEAALVDRDSSLDRNRQVLAQAETELDIRAARIDLYVRRAEELETSLRARDGELAYQRDRFDTEIALKNDHLAMLWESLKSERQVQAEMGAQLAAVSRQVERSSSELRAASGELVRTERRSIAEREEFQSQLRALAQLREAQILLSRNAMDRRTLFDLYAIAAENCWDVIQLAEIIDSLDSSIQSVLKSRAWRTGNFLVRRLLRPMLLRRRLSTDQYSAQCRQSRDLAARWRTTRRDTYDELFKAIPDKNAFNLDSDPAAIAALAELLTRFTPRLYASAGQSFIDFDELLHSADALVRQAEHLLTTRTWKTGDLLVDELGRALLGGKSASMAPQQREIVRLREQLAALKHAVAARAQRYRNFDPDADPTPAISRAPEQMPRNAAISVAAEIGVEPGPPCTVVVPVYNAFDETAKCAESLLRHTDSRHDIVFLDDASTDPRVWPFLEDLARANPNVRAVQNPANLGFTRTVNRGLELATADVILLNSDTEVTRRWVEKLQRAAYSRPDIATVTPLTNSGSAFAVPVNLQANDLPDFMSADMANDLLERLTEARRPEAPTGNGFCMYITRKALDAVGHLDADRFPRGYGEENDFCLRASAQGFVHLIDDTTFIFHKESASFKGEKSGLISAGLKTINELHPGYDRRIQEWLRQDELARLREKLRRIWNETDALPVETALVEDARPTLLFLVHDGTGGTLHHLDDLSSGVWRKYRCVRLQTGGHEWKLSGFDGKNYCQIGAYAFESKWKIADELDRTRAEALADVIQRFAPDIVHVHHLLGTAPEVISTFKRAGAAVVYSFHDFYAICPSFNLLDENRTFCAGNCTPGTGECQVDIDWATYPKLKHAYVHVWRERMRHELTQCDLVVSFSRHARELVLHHFPEIEPERYLVIPHGQDLDGFTPVAAPPNGSTIRVVLTGALGPSKGIDLIEEVLRINRERSGPFEFHFVGTVHPQLDPTLYGAIMHGPYTRKNLPELLRRIRPSFAMIASIWPETFCYTLSECWAAGLPVFASNLGAVGERLIQAGGGWLLDEKRPTAWYESMVRIAASPSEYDSVTARLGTLKTRPAAEMTLIYSAHYDGMGKGPRALEDAKSLEVAHT